MPGPNMKPENDNRTPEEIDADILANFPQSTRAREIRARQGLPDPTGMTETVTVAGKAIPVHNPRAGTLEGFSLVREGSSRTRSGGSSKGFGDTIKQIKSDPGQLAALDAQSETDLEAIKNAQLAAAENVFSDERDQLLRDLFGRGVQQSTIAGEAGGRLLGRRAQVLAEIEGEAGARRIGLRQDIRDARLRALLGAGQLQNQRFDASVRLKVGMAQVDAQNRATGASLKIAAMNDATRRQLGLAELALNEKLGTRGLDIQERLGEAQISQQQRSSILGTIAAGIGSIVPFLSHEALKEQIEEVNEWEMLELVNRTKVYKFKYLPEIGDSRSHIGTLANEAPQEISTGIMIVPQDAIFALYGAVQALSKRVEELEKQ